MRTEALVSQYNIKTPIAPPSRSRGVNEEIFFEGTVKMVRHVGIKCKYACMYVRTPPMYTNPPLYFSDLWSLQGVVSMPVLLKQLADIIKQGIRGAQAGGVRVNTFVPFTDIGKTQLQTSMEKPFIAIFHGGVVREARKQNRGGATVDPYGVGTIWADIEVLDELSEVIRTGGDGKPKETWFSSKYENVEIAGVCVDESELPERLKRILLDKTDDAKVYEDINEAHTWTCPQCNVEAP